MPGLVCRSIDRFRYHASIDSNLHGSLLINRFPILQISSDDCRIDELDKDLIGSNTEVLRICNILRRRVIQKNTSSNDQTHDISRHIHIPQYFCTDWINEEVFELLQYEKCLSRFVGIGHDIIPQFLTICFRKGIVTEVILIQTIHDQRCM